LSSVGKKAPLDFERIAGFITLSDMWRTARAHFDGRRRPLAAVVPFNNAQGRIYARLRSASMAVRSVAFKWA
jgi:hypothetical protein